MYKSLCALWSYHGWFSFPTILLLVTSNLVTSDAASVGLLCT